MTQNHSFRGQVAIVTGAGQGIGRRIALDLVAGGAAVAFVGRDLKKLKKAAKNARAEKRTLTVSADITREDQVRRMVRRVVKQFGRLDILVNNAGARGPTAAIVELELADWKHVVDVNLTGAFLCSREAMKVMLPRRRGCIVNMASVAGQHGYPLRAPYSASKWGVISLTKSLAAEGGSEGIRANAVCPGPVEGPGLNGVIEGRAEKLGVSFEEMRQRFVRPLALGRPVSEEDISCAVQFLCSDAAANITGHVLNVDGGFGIWPAL